MRSCDSSLLRETFHGKRVAIVGSGPGSLDNAPGLVDSHDVVVRVNNYKIGEAQGYRCDVFYSFFGGSILKPAADLQRDGVKLCICKCPNSMFMESRWHKKNRKTNGVDFRGIYRSRADFWFCDTYVPSVDEFMEGFDMLGKHVPTTGFAALLAVLTHEPKHVYMTGFDFFSSRIHNVNERWRPCNPEDPIGHVPEVEREWLKRQSPGLPVSFDKRLSGLMLLKAAA